jgi:hypothetical protein
MLPPPLLKGRRRQRLGFRPCRGVKYSNYGGLNGSAFDPS